MHPHSSNLLHLSWWFPCSLSQQGLFSHFNLFFFFWCPVHTCWMRRKSWLGTQFDSLNRGDSMESSSPLTYCEGCCCSRRSVLQGRALPFLCLALLPASGLLPSTEKILCNFFFNYKVFWPPPLFLVNAGIVQIWFSKKNFNCTNVFWLNQLTNLLALFTNFLATAGLENYCSIKA